MRKYYCENLNEYLYMNVDNLTEIEGDHLIIPEWLRVDVHNDIQVSEEIEKAINEEPGEHYYWANLYYATFEKEYTIIKSTFFDEGDKRYCSIPTKLLLEIVRFWFDELKNNKTKTL